MNSAQVTPDRILVVYNDHSTRAEVARQEVERQLATLELLKGHVTSHTLQSPRVEDNITDVAALIHAGDTVLSVGGDGTYHTVGNAVLTAAAKNVRVGLIPGGNFNDGPHTFNNLKDLRNPLPLLNQDARTVGVHPVEIMINNEFWRHALLYASAGRTAEFAAIFNHPAVRKSLLSGKSSMFRNLARLGCKYLETRDDGYLPPFCRQGDDTVYSHMTDIVNVNGPIMARFMRSGTDLYKTGTFRQSVLDISRLGPNLPFLLNSVIRSRMPGREIGSDIITFTNSSVVSFQVDGEPLLTEVKTIELRKESGVDAQVLQVIKTK